MANSRYINPTSKFKPAAIDLNSMFDDYINFQRRKLRRSESELASDHDLDNLYISASGPKGINMAEMIADPDDDGSSLCTACTFPIFSTPSISFSHGDNMIGFLHHQCAHDLPRQLLHELHPHHTLLLLNQLQLIPTPTSAPACTNCNRICGTIFYQCPYCDFRLDLVCVLQIKILHRSHPHTMMVIRQREAASLTCSSCDSKHHPSSSSATLSYLCNLCGYWLHPDCATLPNAIVHYVDHRHSLFLTYNLPTAPHSVCVVCSSVPKRDSGVYICLNCPYYLVHIRCALTRPISFKPVFIREAKVEDLGRFPFPDENTSLIPYIRQSSSGGDTPRDLDQQRLHPHPLIFHKNDGDSDDQSSRVCNACVQSVSPPFLSCSHCPDFFLHSCCANLPTKIEHRVHRHPLFLSPKAPKSDISAGFSCKGCELRCNGFAYSCRHCDDFSMDIACAFINPAITHEFHKNTHILFMGRDTKFGSDENCNCCSSGLSGICYECSICRNFKLHVRCALLPKTVRHVFDEHPLQLITTVNDDYEVVLCEACEEYVETKSWYYSCSECDQSFHIDCIPAVDRLSRIKLGSTVCVDGHCCAVVLTRQDNVFCRGRRCGDCGETLKTSDNGLAYECSKCFFGIHHGCAGERLLRTIEITAPDN